MNTPNEQKQAAQTASPQEGKNDDNGKDAIILCSFCGLPETETRNFSKTKCPCKSTWYCDTTCQRNHWNDHKTECKRLRAELNRKRLEKIQREIVGDDCSVCLEELSRINSQRWYGILAVARHTINSATSRLKIAI